MNCKQICQLLRNSRLIFHYFSSKNAKQQALATQQVVNTISNLALAAQETAGGITQIKVGTHQLKEAAQNLQAMV